VLADLEPGGAQRVILTVIRHLNRKVFEPHLAIIDRTGPMGRDIPGNVSIHEFKVGKVRYALPGLLRLCRSLEPDTVISTLSHLNLSLIAGKVFFPSHTRLIVREANTPSLRLRHTGHPRVYQLLYRFLYPHADRIICNANYVKRDLERIFAISPQKITVIPNPVDLERIGRAKRNGNDGYSAQKRHLVAVGRLHYQKGFDFLLKAFQNILQRVPDLHLTIVGGGPDEDSLRKTAEDLFITNSVSFAGYQENPYPYMAHADLFVSSSRWEGLPNAVLEALACGTPVVAFDCPGGIREIIRDEENGWLVPAEDWVSLGEKIAELMIQKKYEGRKDLLPSTFLCGNVVRAYEKLLMESSKLKAQSS
jgi:glycosyltransferase involved in cell wall biosynthesis